jgi:4-amino-4-deoxy-L-arabinose transferase-like glycosyltransferase
MASTHILAEKTTSQAYALATRTPLATNQRKIDRLAITLLGLAAAFRLALVLMGWPATDSDEAVIGLMARHVLTQHELPIFFWGQDYMGAFQAYLGAGFFTLFGMSSLSLHLMGLSLTLGFLAAIYALGWATYGRAVGVLALTWLAFGPSLALLRELQTIGGYQDLLLLGALVALGVWARLREPTPLPDNPCAWRRCLLTYIGIGLAAGLGIWSDLLIAPMLVVAFGVLLWARHRELLSRAGLALVMAFLLGALPFLAYNIAHPNATYTQVALQSHPVGQTGLLPTPTNWARQTGSMLSVGLPAVLGSPHLCVAGGNVWLSYPRQLAEIRAQLDGACDAGNVLLSGGFLLVLACIGWQLARIAWGKLALTLRRAGLVKPEEGLVASVGGWYQPWSTFRVLAALRALRSAELSIPRTSAEAQESARLWLRALLLGSVALSLLAYTMNYDAQRYQFTSSRYLLPVYFAAPLLAGALWSVAGPRVSRAWGAFTSWLATIRGSAAITHACLRQPVWRVPSRRLLLEMACIGGLGIALALSMAGGALTLARSRDVGTFGAPVPPADRQLITTLQRLGVQEYYSDYWTCYRIAFETNEHIICAVRGQDGTPSLDLRNNRYQPYVDKLSADPHPAFVLPANTAEDAGFRTEVARIGLSSAHYARAVIGAYTIYYFNPARTSTHEHRSSLQL